MLTILFGLAESLKCSFGQIKKKFNFLEATTYGVRNKVQNKLAMRLFDYLKAFQTSKGFDDASNESRLNQFERFVQHESERILRNSRAHIVSEVNLCDAD
jgi:hypothetical protein